MSLMVSVCPPQMGGMCTLEHILSQEVGAVATTDTNEHTVAPTEDIGDEEEVTNMSLGIGKSRRKVPEAPRGASNTSSG